jgi:ribose transport system substrate-binding protein
VDEGEPVRHPRRGSDGHLGEEAEQHERQGDEQRDQGGRARLARERGGVEHVDLQNALVGFAQSEREANPFRITETESIKEEAARRGINLITTNAESDLNKEISDIRNMIDQGAEVLVISPLTVRTHVKLAFKRLDIHSREEAVEIVRRDQLLTLL